MFQRFVSSSVTFACKSKQAVLSRLSRPFHKLNRHRSSYAAADVYSYNRTINELMKSGSLDPACKLFDEMPVRDVISWNIMISGHYRNGFLRESLVLYNQMVCKGFIENPSTFSSVLSMCSNAGLYEMGLIVHCRSIILGFTRNLYIGSALVDLYMQMGLFDIALRLLSTLQERNIATWNGILRRICETGRSGELFKIYNDMKLDRVEPNGLTFCYLIQGCGYARFLDEGMQLHCCIIKKGLIDSNLFVANALVDFYSACGNLIEAKKLFEVIRRENIISWNSMVSVSASNSDMFHALEIFHEMHFWDKKPSVSSFLGFLKFCSWEKNILLGKQVHCCILKSGLDKVLVQSALIDMYGKCGDIESSVGIFDSIPERNLECCNSLMTTLLKFSLKEDVIELFGLMVDENIGYDEVSLSSTLKALSISVSTNSTSCILIHCCAIKSGFEPDIAVASSLIDAYSRFGEAEKSYKIFNQIISPNAICFTSIITALARNGFGIKCLEMFETMTQNGLKPDRVTFLSVLIGCNHSGLVEEGRSIFHSMQSCYGLQPGRQHYSCFVDLLGRAGLFDEVEQLLKDMPFERDSVIWSSVLRSCAVYQNEHMGKKAARVLMDLDPKEPAGCLQASNFYSYIGDFESSKQLRQDLVETKVSREIGQSLIEVCDHST